MTKRKRGRIVTAANAPQIWTGDALLDRALSLAEFSGADLKKALGRTRDALDAETPTKHITTKNGSEMVIEGGPDHMIRLRAAESIFDLVGFKGKREREGGTGKPVQVTINLSAPAPEPRAVIPRGRLAVHLSGNGHADNGHAEPD